MPENASDFTLVHIEGFINVVFGNEIFIQKCNTESVTFLSIEIKTTNELTIYKLIFAI